MATLLEAIFIAFGESADVLKLADSLTGELQLRQCAGEVSDSSVEPAASNSVIVKLPLTREDDAAVFAEVERWLERHGSIIGSIKSRKIIEFHTFLDSNTGSRILTVPHSIVTICAKLGLDISNQAFRILTKAEYNAIRANAE